MRTPPSVNLSAIAWLLAVAAGIVESILAVTEIAARGELDGGAFIGLGVRVVVYVVAIVLILRMRLGGRWSRIALTGLLSILGLASLLVPSVLAMGRGESFVDAFGNGGELAGAFIAVRLVHIALVVVGTVAMYTPWSNAYFRGARVGTSPRVPTPVAAD